MLLALFGWMDILIFIKWLRPMDIQENILDPKSEPNHGMVSGCPSIITMMIDEFLNLGSPPEGDPQYKLFF